MTLRRFASVLVLSALVGCSAPKFSVAPALGQLEISGDILAVDTSDPNNIVGAASTSLDRLNLGDSETTFMPRIDVAMGPHISISHMGAEFEGQGGTVDGTISFEGQSISANTLVDTKFDIAATNATFTWDLIPGDIELGIGLGVTLVSLDLLVSDNNGNVVAPDSLDSAPVPLPAVRFGWDLDKFVINAQLGAISVDIEEDDTDVDATVFDFDVNVAYKILNASKLRGMAILGFRQFAFDVEGSDLDNAIDFDFDFGGPYIGVNLVL